MRLGCIINHEVSTCEFGKNLAVNLNIQTVEIKSEENEIIKGLKHEADVTQKKLEDIQKENELLESMIDQLEKRVEKNWGCWKLQEEAKRLGENKFGKL